MNRKKNDTMSFIRKLLLLSILIIFAVSLGYSINRIIRDKKETENILSFYKDQMVVVTDEELIPHSFQLSSHEKGCYFTSESGEIFLFSHFWAPYVTGYGGPFKLIIHLTPDYYIKKIHIQEHNETPEWIDKTADWVSDLAGHALIPADSLNDIDSVTGATYTTKGILTVLQKTGQEFYTSIIEGKEGGISRKELKITLPFILLTLFFCSSIILRQKPKKWLRLSFMFLVVSVSGFWLNLQFSSYHILTIVKFSVFIGGIDKNLFFFIVLPLGLMILGNIYCGYLCPFGTLQELISEAVFFINLKIPGKIDSIARFTKYIFLALILLSPVVKGLEPFSKMDLLISAFDFSISAITSIVILFLILSAFSTRFWCRYFCPTGAFLSLFQNLSLFIYRKWGKKNPVLKKLFLIPHINKCDLGVRNYKDNNCLCCDRCRYGKAVKSREPLPGIEEMISPSQQAATKQHARIE